jgi:hypothetical protein
MASTTQVSRRLIEAMLKSKQGRRRFSEAQITPDSTLPHQDLLLTGHEKPLTKRL